MKHPSFLHRGLLAAILVQAAILAAADSARASLFVVPEAALTSPTLNASSIVHFDEIALGSSINGQTIKGFTFTENFPTAVTTNAASGNTNHIALPSLATLVIQPTNYVLTIDMSAPETSFGFGFAVSSPVPVTNALTITLFDGVNNLGALSFNAALDPSFAGGFAGIGSTIAFTRAQITIAPGNAFAIDNVAAVAAAAVPEPGTALAGVALLGLCGTIRRRR